MELPAALLAPTFGGIFIVAGIILLVATRRDSEGSHWSDALDVFGIQRFMYRVAGGRDAYYRASGLLFLLVGVITLVWWIAAR